MSEGDDVVDCAQDQDCTSQSRRRESTQCTFMTRVARLPLDSDEIGVRRMERRCPTQFLPRGNDEII